MNNKIVISSTINIESRIISIIAEMLKVDKSKITPNVSIWDLGAEAVDYLEIIMEIEKELEISFSDIQLADMETVGDIIGCTKTNLKSE